MEAMTPAERAALRELLVKDRRRTCWAIEALPAGRTEFPSTFYSLDTDAGAVLCEDEADAALIAAAVNAFPALLDAADEAERLRAHFESCEDCDECLLQSDPVEFARERGPTGGGDGGGA